LFNEERRNNMVAISKTYREKDLQSLLIDLHDLKNRPYDLTYFNQMFKSALLAFGSSSPDNLSAIERISLINDKQEFSLKLTKQDISFKQVIASIKTSNSLFQLIKKELPDLTKKEWQAVIDFTNFLLADIKYSFGLTYRMKEVFDSGEENRLTPQILTKINNQTKMLIDKYAKKAKIKNTIPFFDKVLFDIQENKEANTKRYGIRLKEYIFLSDLFSILEEINMPDFMNNQTDWEAFNRIMVLMLLAFEGNESLV